MQDRVTGTEEVVKEPTPFERTEHVLDEVLTGWDKSGYFKEIEREGSPNLALVQSGWDYSRDLGGVRIVFRLIRFGDGNAYVLHGAKRDGVEGIEGQKSTGSFIHEMTSEGEGENRVVTLSSTKQALVIANNGLTVWEKPTAGLGESAPALN